MGLAGRVTVLDLVLVLSARDKHKTQEMVFFPKTKGFLCSPQTCTYRDIQESININHH